MSVGTLGRLPEVRGSDLGFVVSHPRRKNKDAPWMGHPWFSVHPRIWELKRGIYG